MLFAFFIQVHTFSISKNLSLFIIFCPNFIYFVKFHCQVFFSTTNFFHDLNQSFCLIIFPPIFSQVLLSSFQGELLKYLPKDLGSSFHFELLFLDPYSRHFTMHSFIYHSLFFCLIS